MEGNFPTVRPIPDTLSECQIAIDELQEMVKDAMRYRWLKEKGVGRQIHADSAGLDVGCGPYICVRLPSCGAPTQYTLEGEVADGWIDRAIEEEATLGKDVN